MTIKDKLCVDQQIFKLPCVVIRQDPVRMWSFKNVLHLISSADDEPYEVAHMEYVAASVQRDLDGNETFMIIFAR